jgi:hypothetical protein
MKYLKKFETQADYEAAQSGLILPNVSLITETNGVAYSPYIDPCKQYDYVEIGGIKWATKNVGACNVTDTGLYFQWGDTSGYTASQVGTDKIFDWANYKYCDGTRSTSNMTKYNSTDGKTILDFSDDAARTNWGGNWRMPTIDEVQVLKNAITSAWTSDYNDSGVAGLICTDKTDSSKVLFFPACGFANGNGVWEVNTKCNYWTSSLDTMYLNSAYEFVLHDNGGYWQWSSWRQSGFQVRGVLDE